ncbi:MAG TPA: hypothetical protein VFF54_08715 [Thermodesulfobacteriota bacterium]|nr:hypothetical protein [Thermodesulfobacteriota bacterium]
MYKNTKMKGLLLISVFIFIGCAGLNIAYWDIGQDFSSIIPLEYYKKNYNKMFDAAIQSGVKEGFNVAYQDKQNGLISLEKLKGSGTCDADGWHIQIQFGKVDGYKAWDIKTKTMRKAGIDDKGYVLTGKTICTPVIGLDHSISRIENAILKVSDQ